MYCPQMKLGACHKDSFRKNSKIQKCTDFCENAFEKNDSPKFILKKIMVYDGYQKRLGTTESTQKNRI